VWKAGRYRPQGGRRAHAAHTVGPAATRSDVFLAAAHWPVCSRAVARPSIAAVLAAGVENENTRQNPGFRAVADAAPSEKDAGARWSKVAASRRSSSRRAAAA